jgi:hypothetical protein
MSIVFIREGDHKKQSNLGEVSESGYIEDEKHARLLVKDPKSPDHFAFTRSESLNGFSKVMVVRYHQIDTHITQTT